MLITHFDFFSWIGRGVRSGPTLPRMLPPPRLPHLSMAPSTTLPPSELGANLNLPPLKLGESSNAYSPQKVYDLKLLLRYYHI